MTIEGKRAIGEADIVDNGPADLLEVGGVGGEVVGITSTRMQICRFFKSGVRILHKCQATRGYTEFTVYTIDNLGTP